MKKIRLWLSLAVFALLQAMLIIFYPESLFFSRPYLFYILLLGVMVLTAFFSNFFQAFALQAVGSVAIIMLHAYGVKFLTFDLLSHAVAEFLIFLATSYIFFVAFERQDAQKALQEKEGLLRSLEGTKVAQIQKLLKNQGSAHFEELTVLFSDIRNFTGLSEVLPANKVYETLNRYYSGVVEIIAEHNGIIDKFLGDGIMVVFGLDHKNNLGPEMAIRAAIKIREYQKNAEFQHLPGGFSLEASVGIATGRVMVGLVGGPNRFEWTVLGDTVNLASRLERMTRKIPTGVLISESTWMQVREIPSLFTRVVGSFAVKGRFTKEAVIEVFNEDAEALAKTKLQWRGEFERAVRAFDSGQHKKARQAFEELLQKLPDDSVVQYYCEESSRF